MFRIFVLALSLAFAAFPALATTTANSIVTPQVPNRGIVQFLQGTDSAGTYKTLYTGGANGSKCVGIYATSNDASASHLVTVQIKVSTVYYGGMAVTVPVNSGFANAAPAVNMMAPANWPGLPIDSDGNPFFYLAASDLLVATFATNLTSTDVLNLVAVCADF